MHRLWFAKASWVVLVSVLVALLAVAACGGDDEPTATTPGIDTDALAALVQAAVKDAIPDAPDAITAEEIAALVETAVAAAAPEGATAEEIAALVEEAVTAATAGGVTAAEVEALVTAAVAEAAAGSSTLTAAEIEGIVTSALSEQADSAARAKLRPIIMADFDWDSGLVMRAVIDKILIDEMGYKLDHISVGSSAAWPALATGDIDVAVEMWTANRVERVAKWVDDLGAIEFTSRLGYHGENLLMVPTYVIEGDPERGIEPMAPDLKTWEDLRQYRDLFSILETAPDGRFLTPNVGWADWPERFEAFDVGFTVQAAGSEAAMLAEIDSAIRKGEPIFFYGFTPHFMTRKWNLTSIPQPPWVEGCRITVFKCGDRIEDLSIMTNTGFKNEFPEVYQFLQNITNVTDEDIGGMLLALDAGSTHEEASQAWLDANETKWRAWIP